MVFKQFIFFSTFLFCFLGCFVGFSLISNKDDKNRLYSWLPYLVFYMVNLLAFGGLIFFNLQTFDFIGSPNTMGLITPILAAGLLWAVAIWVKKEYCTLLVMTILSAGIIWFTPNNYIVFNEALPSWLNQLLSLGLWVLIARTFRYLNGLDALVNIETITVCVGVFLLSLVGGVPQLLGNLSLCLAGSSLAWLVFSWYPSRLHWETSACDSVGFLMAWLVVSVSAEGAGSCAYIFVAYFVVEIVWAIAKKLTFLSAYQDIYANTSYYDSNLSGVLPNDVCKYIIRVNFVLLMFGCFQVYAPNAYSLPLLTTVVIVWNLSKLKNGTKPTQSLKEINQQFYSDLKTGIKDIQNKFDKEE